MRTVFMRYPGGKAKAVTFSYDDGVPQDKRLAEIFHKYGMKATFNFNNEENRPFNYSKEEIKEYFLSKGHEIAVHGANHRANGNMRPIEGIKDVLDCRLQLEERCDSIIRGMAYPDTGITQMGSMGDYAQIKNYLQELDIAYARTLAGDNDSFMLPQDFHAWMPSAHHNNAKIMEWIDKFLAIDISEKAYHAKRVSRLFYIWGHSYEFDNKDNWEHMEEICERLAHNDEIWYATNIEICDYVQAYKRLQYSANGRRIYNPTLYTIWLDIDKKLYSVKPGETICIDE
ncbi:MAG: polysaccharide deacetylase family protein [Oscillospiraceae bacterium]|nr:polysaccharide deacetylase family protein [Oscillospiraceae bacterium]